MISMNPCVDGLYLRMQSNQRDVRMMLALPDFGDKTGPWFLN